MTVIERKPMNTCNLEPCTPDAPCVVCRLDNSEIGFKDWIRPDSRPKPPAEKVETIEAPIIGHEPTKKRRREQSVRKITDEMKTIIRQLWLEETTKQRKGSGKRALDRLQKEHGISISESAFHAHKGALLPGMQRSGRRRVKQLDANTGEVIARHPTCKAASSAVGGVPSSVSHACRGYIQVYRGFRWQYDDE